MSKRKELNLRDVVEVLKRGEWVVSGGYLSKGLSERAVVDVFLSDKLINIKLPNQKLEIPSEGNVVVLSGSHRTITFRRTYVRRENRKKNEGGDWRETLFSGTFLKLSKHKDGATVL